MNRLIITKNGGDDHLDFIIRLVAKVELTDRETEIIRILSMLRAKVLSGDSRKILKEQIGISRENLNNMLIRMQTKGVFDKEWKLADEYRPLVRKIDELVVKFTDTQ